MKKLTQEDIINIRKNPDKQNWVLLSINAELSENFILEFQDKLNWSFLSYNKILSDDFIRDFECKIDWFWISWREDLSDNFIRINISKLNKSVLLINPSVSEKIKQIIKLLY